VPLRVEIRAAILAPGAEPPFVVLAGAGAVVGDLVGENVGLRHRSA
jgi:hypothetical protein